jgi:hypothetical protein
VVPEVQKLTMKAKKANTNTNTNTNANANANVSAKMVTYQQHLSLRLDLE